MEDMLLLNRAFSNFTEASRSLEASYERLRERVAYLTEEVNAKNRQLEEALNETEEAKDYLSGILESIGEAIIVLDADCRVTLINRAAGELMGVAVSSSTGKHVDQLGFRIEADGTDSLLSANGRKYHVISSCSMIRDSDGRARGEVRLFRDVTRIRELESQQERNLRLISMGGMAAKIVHEIRSPLCSIELYAGMLARELAGSDHAGLAKGISTGIKSLNNILTNMLLFAQPRKPSFRPVDIGDVLEESFSLLSPMFEARGIRTFIDAGNGLTVPGDPGLLKQVFLNMLINAIQAMTGEGRIEARAAMSGEHVIVEIADNGEGIRPEEAERIFDPFFSTKERGTGLGLAIAAKIMQAHDGSIKVESEPGKGSCFQLRFPEKKGVETDPRSVCAGGIF